MIFTETVVSCGPYSDQFQTESATQKGACFWLGKSDKLKEEREDAG
jgi:hypothetical protein